MATELDVILEMTDLAGTEGAREVIREIIGEIHEETRSADELIPWVRAVQVARDLGVVEPDVAFYLIDILHEPLRQSHALSDPELIAIAGSMEAIERALGLGEDEALLLHDAPPDFLALDARWNQRADLLVAELLRAEGEVKMATLLQRDREEYDARCASGWDRLIGMDN